MPIFGGSKSKTRSSSQSMQRGENLSYGMNYSGSYLDPMQQANQQALVGQFMDSGLAGGYNPRGLEFNRGRTMQGLEQLGNQQQGYAGALRNQSMQGRNLMNRFARGGNPFLDRQIAGLGQDFGQFYREQLLPGIGSRAAAAGQRGGSRQGIAEGLAAQRTMQEFGQAVTGLRSGAYGMQQDAANQLLSSGISGANQAYGLANQANVAQGQLANQFAGTNMQAAFNPFVIGSQVIGAPSVLSTSFGENLGYGYNYGQSSTKSKGSSGSLSLGFGK